MPNWRDETCETCGAAMPNKLLLLTACFKMPDGNIGVVSPPMAKVCGPACLRGWATWAESVQEAT